MKVLVFGYREDELAYHHSFNELYGFEITFEKEALNEETVEKTAGYEAVWIVTICRITDAITKKLKENGVKYIVSRAAGTDHMDLEALKKYGLKASNVPYYAPGSIAEHTILLALAALRHLKKELRMVEGQNFTLNGLKGRELGRQKAGVFGTGRIGFETVKLLKGFGCEVMVYDTYPRKEVEAYADYYPAQEILETADILLFHCPLTEENYHMIGNETIHRLKKGVCLVNTARGGLFDFKAVLRGLKEGHIGALGFDVYEGEEKYLRKNLDGQPFEEEILRELISLENVIYTAHMSFYTDSAIESMIGVTFENLKEYDVTGQSKNEIVKA